MRELVITCDHCGKKLDTMTDYYDTKFDCIDEYFTADLCSECYVEISQTIRNFCGKGQN